MKALFFLTISMLLAINVITPGALAQNQVLNLDGDGDYVIVPDSPSLNPSSALTLEAWIKPNDLTGEFIAKDEGSQRDYILEVIGRKLRFVVWTPGEIFDAPGVVLDEWQHVAGVWDGVEMRAYIDGVQVGSRAHSGELIDTDAVLYIGQKGCFYNGFIDEVRIWNIARTQEELQTAMNTTLQGNEKGLAGYWNFDDGTANDFSKNGNDGKLYGDAQIVEERLPDEFIYKGVGVVVLEDKIAKPGEQFTVNILGRFAEPLHSFAFDLTFAPSVIQAISVKEGSFLSRDGEKSASPLRAYATSWQTPTIDNKNGVISNIRCSRTGGEGVGEKGVLAILTFEAMKMGNTDLTLKNLHLLSSTGEEITSWAKQGKVDVYIYGSISGVVLDEANNRPIKDAKVEVLKDKFSLSVYSVDDGKYTIKNVSVGSFDVTVYRDRYLPQMVKNVQVKEGETTSNVKFMMTLIRPIKMGDKARNFTLTSADSKTINLTDFKDKIVVIGVGNPYT